jgi:ring-1,2-phenylacetyl-CoA epoxidase subunit PaaE
MSIHFHSIPVKEVRKETAECVSIAFDIPDELRKHFNFKQGQSLTMRMMMNGEEVRRTYSLCSSPLDNEWRVAVKKVDGGLFSTYANEQLKKGDRLEIMEPVGNFYTELNPTDKKNYLAIAAGSGITPVLSIIRTTLETESQSSFTLVYGNRSQRSIIFFEILEGLKNRYMNRFNLVHVLSRERMDSALNSGRINDQKLDMIDRVLPLKTVDEFFICGPEELIFRTRDYLEGRGVVKKQIHFELFNTSIGSSKKKTVNNTSASAAGPTTFSRISVKLDGRNFEFDLPRDQQTTLLDAALQEGADLPYACKGGMCCTCKARLVEGQVSMDVHWGLEDEEVKKGFILTCQSHPLTDKVSVDFDIK